MVVQAGYQHLQTPDSVAPRHRFDYWRTWYSEAVDCAMTLDAVGPASSDSGCAAEVLTAADRVKLIEVRNGPARAAWTRESLEPADALRLTMFVGSSPPAYRWHGVHARFPAGSAALVGRTVPTDAVPEVARLDSLLGTPLLPDPVLDMVVRPTLAAMVGRLDQLAGADPGNLASFWVAAMRLLLGSLAQVPVGPRSGRERPAGSGHSCHRRPAGGSRTGSGDGERRTAHLPAHPVPPVRGRDR